MGYLLETAHSGRFFRPATRDGSISIPGAVYHICHHSAGGGQLSGPGAIEHHLTHHIAIDQHPVEDIIHCRQRMCHLYQKRCHPGTHTAILLDVTGGQELDGAPCCPGIGKVRRSDPGDSLCIDSFRIHIFTGKQGRENGNRAACIISFHICLWIPLRIPFLLGLFQDIFKICPFLIHLS